MTASHSVTQSIAADTPWSDFRIHQYWQLAPDADDSVLIQYAGTTHAALIERLVSGASGQRPGRVLVLGTPIPALAPPMRSWNELFGTDPWPAWLLTRQSIEYLTNRGGAERMSMVGRPQMLDLEEDAEGEARTRGSNSSPPGMPLRFRSTLAKTPSRSPSMTSREQGPTGSAAGQGRGFFGKFAR